MSDISETGRPHRNLWGDRNPNLLANGRRSGRQARAARNETGWFTCIKMIFCRKRTGLTEALAYDTRQRRLASSMVNPVSSAEVKPVQLGAPQTFSGPPQPSSEQKKLSSTRREEHSPPPKSPDTIGTEVDKAIRAAISNDKLKTFEDLCDSILELTKECRSKLHIPSETVKDIESKLIQAYEDLHPVYKERKKDAQGPRSQEHASFKEHTIDELRIRIRHYKAALIQRFIFGLSNEVDKNIAVAKKAGYRYAGHDPVWQILHELSKYKDYIPIGNNTIEKINKIILNKYGGSKKNPVFPFYLKKKNVSNLKKEMRSILLRHVKINRLLKDIKSNRATYETNMLALLECYTRAKFEDTYGPFKKNYVPKSVRQKKDKFAHRAIPEIIDRWQKNGHDEGSLHASDEKPRIEEKDSSTYLSKTSDQLVGAVCYAEFLKSLFKDFKWDEAKQIQFLRHIRKQETEEQETRKGRTESAASFRLVDEEDDDSSGILTEEDILTEEEMVQCGKDFEWDRAIEDCDTKRDGLDTRAVLAALDWILEEKEERQRMYREGIDLTVAAPGGLG